MKRAVAKNPIISGFYPDPSICRVGREFYLVNSSFAYFPGVPIHKSNDLVHWEQIGNVLDRNSQLPLFECGHSQGIYAPTIRYYNGLFYMITTNVSGGGNFIVTAKNAEGPWSEPYYLGEEAQGIDPSLFFDDDGTCYYCGNRSNSESSRYFGDCEVWVQKLDLKTMKLIGESKAIWRSAVQGAVWTEGPHLYKVNNWYYLMYSEGGTGLQHCIATARSRDIMGEYEGYWKNPLLTHRHLGESYPVNYVGHGDLFSVPAEMTLSGEEKWYMVMLASRPVNGCSNMGRETFLAEVTWENEWPVVNPGKGILTSEVDIDLPAQIVSDYVNDFHFYDKKLPYQFVMIRNMENSFYTLEEREGFLRMFLKKETLKELSNPAYLGIRQKYADFCAHTMLEFSPKTKNEVAGLAILQSNQFSLRVEISRSESSENITASVIFARSELENGANGGDKVVLPVMDEIIATKQMGSIADSKRFFLKFICFNQMISIYAGVNNENYSLIADNISIMELCSEKASGFVGNTIGMYASSNGTDSENHADFGWISIHEFNKFHFS